SEEEEDNVTGQGRSMVRHKQPQYPQAARLSHILSKHLADVDHVRRNTLARALTPGLPRAARARILNKHLPKIDPLRRENLMKVLEVHFRVIAKPRRGRPLQLYRDNLSS